jgi:hypothetical protein
MQETILKIGRQYPSHPVFFYTGTESFNVSIEKKQTEGPPKQFKREYRVAVIFPEHFQSSQSH